MGSDLLKNSADFLKCAVCVAGEAICDIMGVEGGIRCVKYLLFFFNFIFWVSSS